MAQKEIYFSRTFHVDKENNKNSTRPIEKKCKIYVNLFLFRI